MIPHAWLPEMRARLVERLVFNFRVPLTELALPRPLRPDPVAGQALLSLCVLDLDRGVCGPIPDSLGFRGVHAAWRVAALDQDDSPAVWVQERVSGSWLVSALSRLGVCAHPYVRIELDPPGAGGRTVRLLDGGQVLVETRFDTEDPPPSRLFSSPEAFSALIARGVRSFAPAREPDRLNLVDLHKADASYAPLRVSRFEALDLPAGAVLDSAYRTVGGDYRWSFEGQVARTVA